MSNNEPADCEARCDELYTEIGEKEYMSAQQIKLLRVVIRGPEVPNTQGTVGDVIYKREHAKRNGIYMTLLLPSWRSGLQYPQRDDERMKVTLAKPPLSKSVGIEFCGSDVDILCDAAAAADTDARVVAALIPLLKYLQDNFRLA